MEVGQLGWQSKVRVKGIRSDPSLPQKTMKMPHQYHEYTKLPKGWVMARRKDDEEVQEVWDKQRQALSNCTMLTWTSYPEFLCSKDV